MSIISINILAFSFSIVTTIKFQVIAEKMIRKGECITLNYISYISIRFPICMDVGLTRGTRIPYCQPIEILGYSSVSVEKCGANRSIPVTLNFILLFTIDSYAHRHLVHYLHPQEKLS